MARAKTVHDTTIEAPASTQVIGGHLSAEDHAHLHARMERGVARRLYEVWVTAGQLEGEKWAWHNQSTRSQQAWVAVARATLGPALQERFSADDIGRLIHA
jgi:hypothetical protein